MPWIFLFLCLWDSFVEKIGASEGLNFMELIAKLKA